MDLTTWLARRWWLLPVLVIVAGPSIGINWGDPAPAVLAVGAVIALVAIDWWIPAVVVNGALVGAYFASGGDNGPIFITVAVAAFLASFRDRTARWLPAVVVSVVLVWAGLIVRGLGEDSLTENLWQSLGTGALVTAAAAVATTLRARRVAVRARQDRAAADEKLRMAQDLHDGVGHGLAVIAMQAGVALHVLDRDLDAARSSLEAIRATSRESLEALRAELAMIAGDDAAPRRPEPGLADLSALVDRVRAAGLRVDIVGDPGVLSEESGVAVHAVIQEALTNVLRHASARTATIRWERGVDELALSVTDDGQTAGSRADATVEGQDEGMGITGMRRRVESLGGTLRVGATSAGGFQVEARLPA